MKKLLIAVAALLSACGQPDSATSSNQAAAPEFTTDDERILYALGVLLADNLADLTLSESEFEFVAAGMREHARGLTPRVEMDLYGPRIEEFANQRMQAGVAEEVAEAKAAGAAFADEMAAEPGAERTASGLVFSSITEGTGANPSADDTVTVHYHGTFLDGSVFDSSVDRGSPETLSLSRVIPCWTEGVQKIRVGGKAKLLCPSDIAYGDSGRQGIPGGATLLFDVELLSID